MRGVALTVATVCFILMLLQVWHMWIEYQKIALTTEQAYKKGFEAGRSSAMASVPKVCTAWWFGEDAKERHKQAVEAYCKGTK